MVRTARYWPYGGHRSGRPAFAFCEHRRVVEHAAYARFAVQFEVAVDHPFPRLQDLCPPIDLIYGVFHWQGVSKGRRGVRARSQRHGTGRAVQRDRPGVACLEFAADQERLEPGPPQCSTSGMTMSRASDSISDLNRPSP